MAFLSKKEFADKCGKTKSWLSVFIPRGKVVLSGEFIDDAIEPNKSFLKKWEVKKLEHDTVEPAPVITAPEVNTTIPKIKKTGSSASYDELEKRLKGLDADKREKEIEKLELQIAKLNGESIPTELAKMVMVQQSKSYIVFLKQTHENMITEIAAAAGLSSKATADLRIKNTALINKMVADVQAESKKMITNIVKTYSDTRGKGERS